jgi:Asp-tRNA(Asn)/Glu-tRNA(Gln) amidotransferase A subunit family amidase
VFARSIEDLALAADVLSVYDEADSAMWRRSRGSHHAVAMEPPPLPPVLGFVRGPVWGEAADITKEAFAELTGALGANCEEVELPASFDGIIQMHADIMLADIARHFGPLAEQGPDKLSERLLSMIEEGRRVTAIAYNNAREHQQLLYRVLESCFDRYVALITPAAPGPAPEGIATTGSPAFCTLWTFLGTPAVSVPLLEADGLPLGVQLVGPLRDDARLLRTARWLVDHLAQASAE